MVDKADTLRGGSYVGPATFARSVSLAYGTPDNVPTPNPPAPQSHASAPTRGAEARASTSAEGRGGDEYEDAESNETGSQPGSTRSGAPKGRLLNDAQRRRLEAQEATALKMQVAEENIKDAIITAPWPVQARLSLALHGAMS